jgi:hypothetical protein
MISKELFTFKLLFNRRRREGSNAAMNCFGNWLE